METLAEKLRRLREEKNQSLQDVAASVGASRAHVWEVETGKTVNPSIDLVRRLANHFKVSVAWLVGETPEWDAHREQSTALYRSVQELSPENLDIVQGLIDGMKRSRNRSS